MKANKAPATTDETGSALETTLQWARVLGMLYLDERGQGIIRKALAEYEELSMTKLFRHDIGTSVPELGGLDYASTEELAEIVNLFAACLHRATALWHSAWKDISYGDPDGARLFSWMMARATRCDIAEKQLAELKAKYIGHGAIGDVSRSQDDE